MHHTPLVMQILYPQQVMDFPRRFVTILLLDLNYPLIGSVVYISYRKPGIYKDT